MTGLKEFLEVFGNLTLANLVQIIFAFVFLYLIYRKVSNYLIERHDAELAKDKQLQEALEATKKYPEYRKQSIEMQKQLAQEMQDIKATLEDHTKRLGAMEEDNKKREVNKLRERLLRNYTYYTSKEKNPLQAWTQMESDAFCDLFTDYEEMGGDGYMHTVVQPAMLSLNIIDMNDVEEISALMRSRK